MVMNSAHCKCFDTRRGFGIIFMSMEVKLWAGHYTQNFVCFHYKSVQHSIKGTCIVASAWIWNKLDLSFKPFSKQRWGHKFGQMIWLEERVFETSWNLKEWKPMSIFNPLRNEQGDRMQWFRPWAYAAYCHVLECIPQPTQTQFPSL